MIRSFTKISTLFKIEYRLSKRLMSKIYLSIFIYLLVGVNPILLGSINTEDHFPILYTTFMAWFHVFLLNLLHIKHNINMSPQQLKIFPLSNYEIVHFFWIRELINFKFLTYLVPVIICILNLFFLKNISITLIYALFACVFYIIFSLLLIIFKIILDEFRNFLKPIQLAGLILAIMIITNKKIATLWNINSLEFASLVVLFFFLIFSFSLFYFLTFYCISREPSKIMYETREGYELGGLDV